MQGSSTKITYVRGGTYHLSSSLSLSSADNGESWLYYPPDGVDSAVLDVGNTLSGGVIVLQGASNITIDGLKVQNFVDYGILGNPGPVGNLGSSDSILDCDVGFNTASSWSTGGITISIPHSTIANNYVHDLGSQGIATYAYYAGQSIDGITIKNNVILRAVQRVSDGGAIYTNMHSGNQSDYVTVSNNYVADQGSPNTWGVHGIYLDDLSSNVSVTGNVVAAPSAGTGTGSGSQYGTNALSAFFDTGGNHNLISGNIVDLGSSASVSVVIFAYPAEAIDVGMQGDTFTGNIVISNFTGALQTHVSANYGYAYSEDTNDPRGYSYTIKNNIYWNYASGGQVFYNGNALNDSAPIQADPQVSGWDYTIQGSSPAYTSSAAFQPILGGWGPPGFVIPQTGVAPSSP